MKNLTLIYCGEDGNAGKVLANQIRGRDDDNKVTLLSCEFFNGPEGEAERVVIMPDVPEHIGSVIREAYPKNIVDAVTPSTPDGIYADVANELSGKPFVTELPAKRRPGRPRKAVA